MLPSTMLRGNVAKKLGQEEKEAVLPYSFTQIRVDSADSGSSKFASKRTRQHEANLRRVLAAAVLLTLSSLVIFILIWRHLFAVDIGQFVPPGEGQSGPHRTFTVRMNTWRREDLLKRSVDHYATCDCVSQIQVVWSDQENKPPQLDLFEEEARAKVAFEVHDTNSLNHRFNVTSPLATTAVFSTDDDLFIPCQDLKFAFETWQSSQLAMVGFTPRVVTYDRVAARYSYRSWRVVRWNGVYNVILTKCCFLHRDHLKTYVEKVPQRVLSYIDEHRNCEDIAMSVVVAKYFATPPLWVKGTVKEIGTSGISALHSHFDERSHCVDFFAEEFGGMPLIEASVKAFPVRTGLLSWL